jgi:hypothetical protein
VPSFDNPSSLDAVCLSDAPFVALSLNIHILLLLSSIAVGFLCYDLLWHAVVDRLSVGVGLFFDWLWLDLTGFEDSSCYEDTLKAWILDYHFFL